MRENFMKKKQNLSTARRSLAEPTTQTQKTTPPQHDKDRPMNGKLFKCWWLWQKANALKTVSRKSDENEYDGLLSFKPQFDQAFNSSQIATNATGAN